jgi:hypothetical protein
MDVGDLDVVAMPRVRRQTLVVAILAVALIGGAALWLWTGSTASSVAPAGERGAPAAAPDLPALHGAPGAHDRRERAPIAPAPPEALPSGPLAPLEIAADDRLEVVLVDVATGKPMPDLLLGWAASRLGPLGSRVAPATATDADGHVILPASNLGRLEVVGGGWHVLKRSRAEIDADGQLHLVGILRVHVTVAAAPGVERALDPTTVQVLIDPLQYEVKAADEPAAPFSTAWLRRHRLSSPVSAAPDGSGQVTIESLRGARLIAKAHANGWRADAVEVPKPTEARPADVEVRLELRPVHVLRARVVDTSGRPVGGARLSASVKVPVGAGASLSEAAARERLPSYGMSMVVRAGGSGSLVFTRSVASAPDGRLEIDLDADREFTLVTRAPGMLTDFRTLRTGEDAEIEMVLLTAAGSGPRVPVLRGGKPFTGRTLARTDVTDPDLQLGCSLEVDAEGTVPAREFREGRSYLFLVPGDEHLTRYVRWDGRETLDLDALETDTGRFFATLR